MKIYKSLDYIQYIEILKYMSLKLSIVDKLLTTLQWS